MSIEAVLFDLDDTLFDRHRAQIDVLRVIRDSHPDVLGAVDEERMIRAFRESDAIANREFYNGGNLDTVRVGRARHFLRLLGRDEAPAQDLAGAYVSAYAEVRCPMAGARELVASLATRFPLGIVTNGFPDVQHSKLQGLGLGDVFCCVVISGEVGVWKPDPEVFRMAAGQVGKKPDRCLYVGNNFHDDVVGAKEAGMRACWLNPACEAVPDDSVAPDYEIGTLGGLAEILRLE